MPSLSAAVSIPAPSPAAVGTPARAHSSMDQLPKLAVGRKETSESVTSGDEEVFDEPSGLKPRPSTTLNLTGATIRDSSYPGEAADDAGEQQQGIIYKFMIPLSRACYRIARHLMPAHTAPLFAACPSQHQQRPCCW